MLVLPGDLEASPRESQEELRVLVQPEIVRLHREPDFAGNLPSRLRPDWDTYFIGICYAVAERGDCTRSKVGAVIVRNHRIVSTGYNGAPAGEPGCLEGACPRGRHYQTVEAVSFHTLGMCYCGSTWPCSESAEPGKGTYEDCISLHAEVNAVVYAGRDKCLGATIYVTREPCSWCSKVIAAAGITRVVIP